MPVYKTKIGMDSYCYIEIDAFLFNYVDINISVFIPIYQDVGI